MSERIELTEALECATKLIADADALLIGAGAGMGVDSGLPDFRGNEGFWRAYPPMKELGLSFYDLANPSWFVNDPNRAWGFYGHRRNLYRDVRPHGGFATLKKWASRFAGGAFVFTSNVDSHFQKSGFSKDQVVECHGSIEFNQCVRPCCHSIWPASTAEIEVDLTTFRAAGSLPACESCGEPARPNILMFEDWSWIESRTSQQYDHFKSWLTKLAGKKLVVVEIGAGTAVPTVRHQCEQIAARFDGDLIRVNPRESQGAGVVSLACGGMEAINALDQMLPS